MSARFVAVDFLGPPTGALEQYDLLIDKGTFDAISLMSGEEGVESKVEGRSEAHMDRVRGLCAPFKASLLRIWASPATTRFLITSCNWTRTELCALFAPELILEHQIEHPSFSFGGASGQVVTTLIFSHSH